MKRFAVPPPAAPLPAEPEPLNLESVIGALLLSAKSNAAAGQKLERLSQSLDERKEVHVTILRDAKGDMKKLVITRSA